MESAARGAVELEEDIWDAQVDSNLKSVLLSCKHVLTIMEKQGSGAIINMSSNSGMCCTGSAQVAYAATKARVIQLSCVEIFTDQCVSCTVRSLADESFDVVVCHD